LLSLPDAIIIKEQLHSLWSNEPVNVLHRQSPWILH